MADRHAVHHDQLPAISPDSVGWPFGSSDATAAMAMQAASRLQQKSLLMHSPKMRRLCGIGGGREVGRRREKIGDENHQLRLVLAH